MGAHGPIPSDTYFTVLSNIVFYYPVSTHRSHPRCKKTLYITLPTYQRPVDSSDPTVARAIRADMLDLASDSASLCWSTGVHGYTYTLKRDLGCCTHRLMQHAYSTADIYDKDRHHSLPVHHMYRYATYVLHSHMYMYCVVCVSVVWLTSLPELRDEMCVCVCVSARPNAPPRPAYNDRFGLPRTRVQRPQ